MKISCNVIKDLLPLYQDDICSEDSKQIIEDHLLDCEECRKEMENNSEPFIIENSFTNDKEVLDLKKLSKEWNKKLLFSMLKGAASTFLIVALIILLIYIFVGIKVG